MAPRWSVCTAPPPPPLPALPSSDAPLAPGLSEAGRFLDRRCALSADALSALRSRERCHSGASAPRLLLGAPNNKTSEARPAWGLPSAGCPAPSAFLLSEYPARHAALKREGRVLQLCYHAPLGNYLEALPAAFLASLLLELALVLHCDVQPGEHMAQFRTRTAQLLPRYFAGPHVDWDGRVSLPDNATVLRLRGAHFGELRPLSSGGARARLNTRAVPQSLLVERHNRARLQRLLGAGLAAHTNLAGCVLRYLLRPRAALDALLDALPNRPARASLGPPGTGSGVTAGSGAGAGSAGGVTTLRAVALHVRLGDTFLPDVGRHERDSRSAAYQRDPVRVFGCLLRAMAEADGGCLAAVVVADSGWVGVCARRLLGPSVVLSGGVALHPHKSNGGLRALGSEAVEKLFLDWFLLASARGLLTFVDGSSFSRTARAFRDASDPAGWALRLGLQLGPDPQACAQPRPGEERAVVWSSSGAQLALCALAAPLGCEGGGLCRLAGRPLAGELVLLLLLLLALLALALCTLGALALSARRSRLARSPRRPGRAGPRCRCCCAGPCAQAAEAEGSSDERRGFLQPEPDSS